MNLILTKGTILILHHIKFSFRRASLQCYQSQIIPSETQMNGILCMIRLARSRVYLSIVIRFPISNIVNNRTWIMPMKLNKYTRKLIIFLPCVLLINNKSPFFFHFYLRECYTNKIQSMEYFQANIPQFFFLIKFPTFNSYLSIISIHSYSWKAFVNPRKKKKRNFQPKLINIR